MALNIIQAAGAFFKTVLQALLIPFKGLAANKGVVRLVLAVVLLLVVAAGIGFSINHFKDKGKAKKTKELSGEKQREASEKPALQPSSPHKIIEQGKKLIEGGKKEETALKSRESAPAGTAPQTEQFPQAPAGPEAETPAVKPVERVQKGHHIRRPKTKKDTPALVAQLKGALESDKEGKLMQAVKALEQKDIDAVSLLREELVNNFGNAKVRKNAVWGLFYSGKEEALPVLKTVLKTDPSDEVRIAALFAIDALLGKDAVPLLEETYKNDASEKVRKKADEYIHIRSTDR